jgi:2-amino-4-hydroxy-6-hydroxymethyldihydropteridine diphosphokinase
MARAYVGLGANLGEPAATIADAVSRLAAIPAIEVVATSTLRETDPVGPIQNQPRFLNGVVALETSLGARELLETLLSVELALGRRRDGPIGGPRTIDLDLLLYDDLSMAEPGLTLPHPRLHERRFALEPLVELHPGLEVPGKGTVEALLARLH